MLFFYTHWSTTVVLLRVAIREGKAVNEAEHLTFIFKTVDNKAWGLTSTVPLVFHVAVRKHAIFYTFIIFLLLCLETRKASCEI